MKKLSDEYDWSLEVDDDGRTKWKKVKREVVSDDKEKSKVGTSTDPNYDNFETSTSFYQDFNLMSNYNSSSVSGNVDFTEQPKETRKEYFNQINKEYTQWWANEGWGPGSSVNIKATDSGDVITFGWGIGFIDQMNRDYSYPVKYTSDGRPYATVEGQWGNNNEHTVWLDDTWNDLGYTSISDYIANA